MDNWITYFLVALGCLSQAAGLSSLVGIRNTCEGKACNPQMGNLAIGRRIVTNTICGQNATELYCTYTENPDLTCRKPKCDKCNSAHRHHAHLPTSMSDWSFHFPNTWWQSAEGVQWETIQMDLETEFYFTHTIMIFKSPRPAAMVLERSQDYGKTWKTYKYFSTNCSQMFGLADDVNEKGAICTSRYSQAFPCTRGEVIYRALSPPYSAEDHYSREAQDQLKITNIRIQLLKRQQCPCQNKDPDLKSQRFAHYAIYDFIVKGSCFCNGHADQCIPAVGYKPVKSHTFHVVHGKCICKHNTAGDHCEQCDPLYNDQPWQPANGKSGAPNECKKCTCNGHADSCHFDRDIWLASGNRSGGVCDNCQHNTEGQQCHRCKNGFYHDPQKPFSAPDACRSCSCHPVGSVSISSNITPPCAASTGDCLCKPGVAGPNCDHCMVGYWGFGEYGCRPCDCAVNCDPYTGDCLTNSRPDVEFLDFHSMLNMNESAWKWEDLQGFSALQHPGKCECKEQVLDSSRMFCSMKYAYVIKAKILAAHDKGSHAEVSVQIKKVLKMTKLKIFQGNQSLYPESWTSRGCTCPVLNPGKVYVVAGHEDVKRGKLIVNTKSFVKPWTPHLTRKVLHILKNYCK
ncbi:netrin-4 [Protopterus annectens]|uniref:netrin-4 n=1 Tax=Protopterus annectens TaxID=7888 RepID=UPI001CFB7F63|nr:netrin-4 [Protopterus annectens]